MRYFNPEVALQVQVPDYNKVFDSIQEGMQLGNQIKEQRQQGILSRLLAQNTDADGQIDYTKALQSIQSNPNQSYQPAMINTLSGLIQQQKTAQLKAQQEALKSDAELNKTYAETGKIKNEGIGKGLENSEKKFGALNQIFQAAALSGSKNNILLGLNGALKSGLIDQDMFNQQQQIIQLMTPEEIRSYASNITLGNSKDPASYLFRTANNVADNETSIKNNQNTVNATLSGQQVQKEIAAANREQELTIANAKAKAEQEGGSIQVFGDKVYFIDKKGNATPVSHDTKGQIINASKSGITATSKAEEKLRIDRVNAVLDEVTKILPQSTNSYIGRGIDYGARLVGHATSGDMAAAKLGTLGGQLVALMPKMSGPQSDKDVEMYKQMAGKLDDATLPIEVRQEALDAIRSLNNKYAEMSNQTPSIPFRNAGQQSNGSQNKSYASYFD